MACDLCGAAGLVAAVPSSAGADHPAGWGEAVSVRETPEERDARLALERSTREVARLIRDRLRPGVGFALFLYDFGPKGALAYVANGDREDIAKVLREFLEQWEKGTS